MEPYNERRGNRKMKNLTLSYFSFYISNISPLPQIDTEIAEFVNSQMYHRSTSLSRVVSGGGKGFSSTLWLVYLKHFQTSTLWFFWTFCPNLKALILLDISRNLKALILLKILLNLLMLLALHRWGIESGVGIDYSLTQSNQSYTHVSAFIVANNRLQDMPTKFQHRQTSWQTENPDCQDIGKKTNKILAECRGPQPQKKKRWLQYSQLRKVREKPEKVLYSGTFQSYRPRKCAQTKAQVQQWLMWL